jgi:hypothetical protein
MRLIAAIMSVDGDDDTPSPNGFSLSFKTARHSARVAAIGCGSKLQDSTIRAIALAAMKNSATQRKATDTASFGSAKRLRARSYVLIVRIDLQGPASLHPGFFQCSLTEPWLLSLGALRLLGGTW